MCALAPASALQDGHGGADRGFEHLGFDDNAFSALETDFENVLTELSSDAQLERFRLEYETLYRALKKSHESEKRLVKKCTELTSDIATTQQKEAAAVKLSQEDQNTIATLKNDILRISTSVESSLIKEKETKEELGTIKEEIEGLRVEVKQGAGSSTQQEAKLRDLKLTHDDMIRERDSSAHQVMQLRTDITDLTDRLKAVEAEKATLDTAVADLRRDIEGKRAETEKEKRRKEREEARLKELKAVLEQRQADLKGKQASVAKGAEHASKLEIDLREQKQSTDRALKEVDLFATRVSKLGDELREQLTKNSQLAGENATRQNELVSKTQEVKAIKAEEKRMAELREKLLKRIAHLDVRPRRCEVDAAPPRHRAAAPPRRRDLTAAYRQSCVEHAP